MVKTKERKRGPGRPSLDPDGGVSVPLMVRLTKAQLAKLHLLVKKGRAPSLASAARWAIEQAS